MRRCRRLTMLLVCLALLSTTCGSAPTDDYGDRIGQRETSGDNCSVEGTGPDRSRVAVAREPDVQGRPICDDLEVRRVDPDIDPLIRSIGCPDDPTNKDPDACGYRVLAGLQIEPSPRQFDATGVPILYDLRHDGTNDTKECRKLKDAGLAGVECNGVPGQDHVVSFAIFNVDANGQWQSVGSATTEERTDEPELVKGTATHWSALWLTALPEGQPLASRTISTQVRSRFTSAQPSSPQVPLQVALAFNQAGNVLQADGPRELIVSLQGLSVLSVADSCGGLGSAHLILDCAFPPGTGLVVESQGTQGVLRSLDETTVIEVSSLAVHR